MACPRRGGRSSGRVRLKLWLSCVVALGPAVAQTQTPPPPENSEFIRSGFLFRESRTVNAAARLPDFPRAQIAASLASEPGALDAHVDRVLVGGEAKHLHHLIASLGDRLGRGPQTLAAFVARTEQILSDHHLTNGILTIATFDRDSQNQGVIRIRIQQPDISSVEIIGAPDNIRPYLNGLGNRLKNGSPMSEERLERYLILFNRVPGCKAQLEVRSGEPVGSGARMMLRVDYDRVSAKSELKNRGARGIGREVVVNKVVVNDVFAGADFVDLRATINLAPGRALILDATYGVNLNPDGLALEMSSFSSSVRPERLRTGGDQLDIKIRSFDATITRPLWLREKSQLFVSIAAASGQSRIAINGPAVIDEQRWLGSISAEWTRLAFGGVNTGAVSISHGFAILGATRRGDPLASRGGEGADFTYVAFEGSREQQVTPWAALITNIYLQASTQALFITDQCGYGGGDYGRAFELNAIFGDNCFQGSAELRLSPNALNFASISFEPYFYADGAAMRQIGVPDPAQAARAGRMSTGGGLRFSISKKLSAQFEFTQALRRDTPTGAGQERSFYFEIGADL